MNMYKEYPNIPLIQKKLMLNIKYWISGTEELSAIFLVPYTQNI